MKKKINVARFILSKCYQYTPRIFYFELLNSLLRLISFFLIIFLPSMSIYLIQNIEALNQTLMIMELYISLIFIVNFGSAVITTKTTKYRTLFEYFFVEDLGKQMMSSPYYQMEDAAFMTLFEQAAYPIKDGYHARILLEAFPKMIQTIFMMIGSLIIVLTIKPLILLIILIIVAIHTLFNHFLVKLEVLHQKNNVNDNRLYRYYLNILQQPKVIKDIKIYHVIPLFKNKTKELFDRYIAEGEMLYHSRELRNILGQGVSSILLISVYSILILTSKGALSAVLIVLIVNAALGLTSSLTDFTQQLLDVNSAIVYYESTYDFYELIETYIPTGTKVLKEPIRTIEFDNVHFTYPKTDKEILKGLSFILDLNQSYSIVGRNGCGKSTMIKLLSRLYEPTSGHIYINGIDVKELEYESYLRQISIIFQDFQVLKYSIKDNIILNQAYDEDIYQKAIKESLLDTELDKFPNRDLTYITKDFNEEGISLSKGQEQKLAIARCIYHQGDVMILDEPTSSLDPIVEEEVYKHFKTITANKLSILISHRLSSCHYSDQILMIEDGVIIEQGSHHELMNQQGKYATMFNTQAQHYK